MTLFQGLKGLRRPLARLASSAKGQGQKGPGGSAGQGQSAAPSMKQADPPAKVFKKVDSGKLGPGASKESDYKNPEYFQYHRFTYSEMDVAMQKMRVPQPKAK